LRYQIIENFLKPEECEQIIQMAQGKLQPSGGYDVDTGQTVITDYRTSEQLYLQRLGETELVASIENRIASLTGLPVENGEPFQILRYGINGHYKVHWDYFDPRYSGNAGALAQGGQRVATMLTYLNTPQKGGDTFFPYHQEENIPMRIKPETGKAILWWNVDEQGNIDETTFHAGEDVIEGEKWVLTKWLRERKFTYYY
jgi:prolyl 4-hydroxylase